MYRSPGLFIWLDDTDVSGNWTCFLDILLPVGLFSDNRGLWHAVGLWVGVAFVSLFKVAPFLELRHDVVAVVVAGWVTYLTTGTFKGYCMRGKYVLYGEKKSFSLRQCEFCEVTMEIVVKRHKSYGQYVSFLWKLSTGKFYLCDNNSMWRIPST